MQVIRGEIKISYLMNYIHSIFTTVLIFNFLFTLWLFIFLMVNYKKEFVVEAVEYYL